MKAYITYLDYIECYVMQVDNHSNFYGTLNEIQEICKEYNYEMIFK